MLVTPAAEQPSRRAQAWLTYNVGRTMKTAAPIIFSVSSAQLVELTEIERFEDGSGFVSNIRIVSGEFSCSGRRFYFDDLPGFSANLRKGYQQVKGHAELRQRYEEEFVRFEFTTRGHVIVTGLLTDYGQLAQRLQFRFEADQSFVPPFLASIESALADFR
jgi:hypothetical protein